MKGEPPLAAPSSHFEEDLSATLNQLDLAAPSAPSSLPKPIPLVRSTSDKRQAVPNTFSHDISPSPERAPLARASVESSSSSHFPIVTPSDTHHLIKPVISPAPPSRRTCVILQEACTKHRYERNKDGGSIVERPERIRAVKTGLAAAWARLEARNVLHGGTRWEGSAGATAGTSAGGEGELEAMMMGLGIKDTPGKEVLGGPFDILYSTAVLPVDDPALQFIHPSPNLPPSTTATPLPSPPPAPATTRSNRTPSASPAKSTPAAPFSAPPPPPPFDTSLPWPQQLSSLCKNAGQAMLSPPYSEIPSHLPQGDLYLSEGSEEAIFGALGAVCEGVDRVVEGSRTPGIGYDRAFVAIRPPGHVSRLAALRTRQSSANPSPDLQHCCEAAPMGFCFVNNVAVAAAHG